MPLNFLPDSTRRNISLNCTDGEFCKLMLLLDELKKNVKLALYEKIPDEAINYFNEKLKRYKDKLENIITNKSQNEDHSRKCLNIDELYLDVEAVLDKLEQRKKIIEHTSTNDDTADEATSQDISLKLPEFHGENFEEWIKFSSVFTNLVHNNTQLPNSTKLNYLREKLKNKAARTLIGYLLSGPESNYTLAWEMLEKRYDNKRILFTSKLDCLLDIEIMKSNNSKSVQKMHDIAKECIYLMKQHLNIGASADEIFAHIIMRKMDDGTRAQYERYVRKTKSIQKLSDVMEFLEQQFEILENLQRNAEPKKVVDDLETLNSSFNDDGLLMHKSEIIWMLPHIL